MKKPPTDVGASVRARLLGLAREQGEDFQLLLTRYANERLLFRLSASGHAQQFVLKGAALFALWTGKPHRATRDLDLLGFGDPGVAHVREVFTKVLAHDVVDDGVHFDLATLAVDLIRDDQEYGGVRAEVVARVTNARVRLQVDVGFGDAVTPEALVVEIPPLLDFPAPRLRAYPRETVVAEKLEAMVKLGMANRGWSRPQRATRSRGCACWVEGETSKQARPKHSPCRLAGHSRSPIDPRSSR
jgi:predicted nucleotidyltransferase component of viral defense system